MANIKITAGNNKVSAVKGKFTFETELLRDEAGNEKIQIVGSLTTHRYFDDIKEIESDRFILKNVEVFHEVFGTEDFNILYEFIANDYWIKGGETNLTEELEQVLEKKFYNDETSNSWEGR